LAAADTRVMRSVRRMLAPGAQASCRVIHCCSSSPVPARTFLRIAPWAYPAWPTMEGLSTVVSMLSPFTPGA
jgi:hypothetical protein